MHTLPPIYLVTPDPTGATRHVAQGLMGSMWPEQKRHRERAANEVERAVDDHPNTQVARPPDGKDERGERDEDRRIEPGLPEVIQREEREVDPGSSIAIARQAWEQVATEVHL